MFWPSLRLTGRSNDLVLSRSAPTCVSSTGWILKGPNGRGLALFFCWRSAVRFCGLAAAEPAKSYLVLMTKHVRFGLPLQPIDATHASSANSKEPKPIDWWSSSSFGHPSATASTILRQWPRYSCHAPSTTMSGKGVSVRELSRSSTLPI